MTRRVPLPIVLSLFFASGATALAYETVWVRQLSLSFGITVHAISAVLVAYMFGLSLGARMVGRWADRVENPLRAYAFFELAIAAYALLAHSLLTDALPMISRGIYATLPETALIINFARFFVAFALLVIPTILMGGTLPLLGRFITTSSDSTGTYLGRLYGLNTLGAVVGTAVAGFWMLKNLGIYGTTICAVILNLTIGLLALWLSRGVRVDVAARRETSTQTAPPPAGDIRLLHFVLFLSGYAALAYQVMWNRTLALYVHNSIYAFSMILMVFLLGVALGSLVFSRYAMRWSSLRTLGIVQLALGGYVWLSVYLTGLLPKLIFPVSWVLGTSSWASALVIMAFASAIIVFVPTLLMGISFPLATHLGTSRSEEVGARIGGFYALNTLGNILGSLITGFVLIETIGLRNSFAVAVGCNLLGGFLLVLRRDTPRWRSVPAWAATAAALLLFVISVDREIFRSFYEAASGNLLFYKEEITDTVMVYERANGDRRIRYSDGRGTAGTDTDTVNRLYGHLPMLLHPDADRVLSIGFGVGNTLSALAHHQPSRLLLVELSTGVVEAAPFFPTNQNVLETPNLELRFEDGRNHLLVSQEEFDVIQLEPPEIHTASVVNLYTKEFYDLAKAHMADDGIICQWLNVVLMPEYELKMLLRTFQDAFPHASLWTGGRSWDLILMGSRSPIRLRPEELWNRYRRPLVEADLARMDLRSPQSLLSYHVLGPDALADYVGDVPPISDDWTYVDFSVPQSHEAGFGVFLYQTHMIGGRPDNADRFRHRWEMLANREAANYLIDAEGLSPAERTEFFEVLDEETETRRRESREEIARLDAS